MNESKLSIQAKPPQFNHTQPNEHNAVSGMATLSETLSSCSEAGFDDMPGDALGNNAFFVASKSYQRFQQSRKLLDARSNVDTEEYRKIDKIRYKMLATTRKILNTYAEKTHRIAECHYGFAPNGRPPQISHSSNTHSSRWVNLKKCDNEFCPVCSAHVGIETRERIANIMAQAYVHGFQPVMLTLTMQHDARHSCDNNVTAMSDAWRKFIQSREYRRIAKKYGIWGYLRGTDQTFSPVNGLHFHFHIILLIHPDKFDERDWQLDFDDDSLWSQFADLWQHVVAAVGRDCDKEVGCHFQIGDQYIAEYIAKHGREPKESRWDITAEISLKTVKRAPDEHYTLFELMILAHAGDSWASMMYAEFCDAMHNRNRLRMSRNVLELEKSIPEAEEPAEEPVEAEELIPNFELTFDAFRVARNTRNKRAQWLSWHEQKLFQQLAYDVAVCTVLGRFQWLSTTSVNPIKDGWHSVYVTDLHDDTNALIGLVHVEQGRAKEIKVTQQLDSGFYGRFITAGGDDVPAHGRDPDSDPVRVGPQLRQLGLV